METTLRPDLTQLAATIHSNAVQHGFWEDNYSDAHYLTLVVCELAEAVEADRAGRYHYAKVIHKQPMPKAEEWKPVIGYEKDYEVSNMGNVRSTGILAWNGSGYYRKPSKILKAGVGNGYRTVSLRGRTQKIAVLVANAFIGTVDKGKYYVNHIDGNKLNDCVNNLEYTTPQENSLHAYRTGLRTQKGKLSYEQRCAIAFLHKSGLKYTTILKMQKWGVTKAAIQRICKEYAKYTDSVEFELADTVIRLLDLAGARKCELDNACAIVGSIHKSRAFTENVWDIVSKITSSDLTTQERIISGIVAVEILATAYDIDLWWHVKAKMQYNASRPHKHGKKY